MIESIISRLSSEVAILEHRVEGAGSFFDLIHRNALPQHTPAAHVVHLGLIGRQADAGAGAFTQGIEEAIAVILTIRNHTPAGQKVLAELRDLVFAIVYAIAGWAPSDQTGVFRMTRGATLSAPNGTVIYQIDFVITDQLRIL